MQRTPTNTENLRERFPEEYDTLQQKSDLVLSCAQQFSWAGGYGQLFGGAGIIQKLPFRSFVGIKKTTTGKITYKSARAYRPRDQKFTDLVLSHFLDTDITDTFEQHILPLLGQEATWTGYDIHLLMECDWLDAVPCLVSFAAALHLLSGSLTPDFFRLTVAELQRHPKLITLWKTVCFLENSHLYTPSIAEVVVALLEARLPVLIQTEDLRPLLSQDGRFLLHAEQLDRIDTCSWYTYLFDEHFPKHQHMPIEWGILAPESQQMSTLHFPYTKARPHFGDMKHLESYMKQTTLFEDTSPTHDPYWFRRKIELLHFYTMASVDTLRRSLVSYDANPFLHALHAMHEISELLQHHRLDHVTAPGSAPFKAFLKKHLRGNYKYLVTEKGMRGDAKVFFAAPRHILSGQMETLTHLYPETGAASFSYLSWLDGFGNAGVAIEYQRPFLLHTTTEDTSLQTVGMSVPDILVDCQRHKLYLGGHRVTSNDLRSQHFTVELLHMLYTHNNALPFEDLPRLSYTDSENELHQKVLAPLQRAIVKYTGKDISLQCIDRHVRLELGETTLSFTHQKHPGMLCHKTAATQPHLVAM